MAQDMSPPGAASGTTTYIETDQTAQSVVIPSIVTRSESIALYFADDLEEFLRLSHIDLARELHIPSDYSHDPKDIVELLYDDLSHMLRDELITGIHLLLSDDEQDPNTGSYLVRYHVQYTIDASQGQTPPGGSPQRFGGLIAPPRDAWTGARFALLIDWNASARSKRQHVRRPIYNFDWVPESARFDATSVLCYREGELAVDGARVIRKETHLP